jgi:hypothetical protein
MTETVTRFPKKKPGPALSIAFDAIIRQHRAQRP